MRATYDPRVDWLIAAGIVLLAIPLGVLAQRRGWIDLSGRTAARSGGSAPLGPIDEIFTPSRYEAQLEVDRQTVLPAPAPVPGDGAGDRDVYAGSVRIDLSRR